MPLATHSSFYVFYHNTNTLSSTLSDSSMSQASSGHRGANPPFNRRQSRTTHGPSQASPLADVPLAGPSDASSCGSTQNIPAATETNTMPIGRGPLARRTIALSVAASQENAGTSSFTEATDRVRMPPPQAPECPSMWPESEGLRSRGRRDSAGESSMLSTATDPTQPVSPPPISYLASQRLGGGSAAHRENTRSRLPLSPATAQIVQELEDLLDSNPFEWPSNDTEMPDMFAEPALPQGGEADNLPSQPEAFVPEASEALDLIFNANANHSTMFDGEGSLTALASAIPPPPGLALHPLRSPGRFSAVGEMEALPPLLSGPATDAPPPGALPIDTQVTLGFSQVSGGFYRPQQDTPPSGHHVNPVVAEQNLYYSSGNPVPRFQTMSQTPWVVAPGEIPTISGASTAGGGSNIFGNRNFGCSSVHDTEYMGADSSGAGFPPLSAITRPGFSDETLLSDSRTHLVQEWEGSAHHTPGPPAPSGSSTGYSSVGQPYLYSAADPLLSGPSQASAAQLGGHPFPMDPLGIGEPLIFHIPAPPAIHHRATYSSYPPLPLPPREQTNRPWTMDVSEDGTQYISLRNCELRFPTQGDENGASSGVWAGWPEGRLNPIGGHLLEIRGSNSGTVIVTATPPVEVQEENVENSDSSNQQPVTKKQRTTQHRQRTQRTPGQTSTDDVRIVDVTSSAGGKSIPDWVSKAVAAEQAQGNARTRGETKTPAKSHRKSQRSREAVSLAVAESSTPAAKELIPSRKAGVTPIGSSMPYRREGGGAVGNDSLLTSGKRAATPAPRRLTPVVEIIVPAVPRAMSNAPTEVAPVPEKPRSRGRPRRMSVVEKPVASEKNTLVDAELHTGPMVALGWLVPYKRGESICLPGCESLPETIGCLRCFDKRFPGRREREGLMNPEMVFRRQKKVLASRERLEARVGHSLPALSMEPATTQSASGGSKSARKRSISVKKSQVDVPSNLSGSTKKGKAPTSAKSVLPERSVGRHVHAPVEAPGARASARLSVPPSLQAPVTRASAEVSPSCHAKAVSTRGSTRRSTLSIMPTKNAARASSERVRRSTIDTSETQVPEKQAPGQASSSKTRGSTPSGRRLPARDPKGKFILEGKTADTSSSAAVRSTSRKASVKGKAVVDSPEKKDDSAEDSPYPDFESRHRPELEEESESESEEESKSEDSSEEDSSEYKA